MEKARLRRRSTRQGRWSSARPPPLRDAASPRRKDDAQQAKQGKPEPFTAVAAGEAASHAEEEAAQEAEQRRQATGRGCAGLLRLRP